MLKIWIIVFTLAVFIVLHCEIVINEFLYDPIGSDTGYEWVELYNPSGNAVNLLDWTLLKAGTNFTECYVFPAYELLPGDFLLLGETHVEGAHLYASLALQNGGSATDGIRLQSSDGSYTDTVLYDEPNSNSLPDDKLDPGIWFAPDVDSGHSLARKHDGIDSDNSEQDWFDCLEPSPGSENFYPVDLAVKNLEIIEVEGFFQTEFWIFNLSSESVDNSVANLEIYINNWYLDNLEFPSILGGDSLRLEYCFSYEQPGWHLTAISVNCLYDNNLANNYISSSILVGNSPFVLNEIMFYPLAEGSEWIELFNLSSCGYHVYNFKIFDASGGNIYFSGYLESQEYLVVCENLKNFMDQFPQAPLNKCVQADSWTTLNNGEESICLLDFYDLQLDSLYYLNPDCPAGISLERINPCLPPLPENWSHSLVEGTPGARNSIYVNWVPTSSRLDVQPSPFSPYRGEHTVIDFDLPTRLSRVTIRIFDLKGRLVNLLADQIAQAARGEFIWNGNNLSGHKLLPGVYIVLLEAVSRETEEVYREQTTVVLAR